MLPLKPVVPISAEHRTDIYHRVAMQAQKGLQPCYVLGQPFTVKASTSRCRGLTRLQPQSGKSGRSTDCRIRCSAQRQSPERLAAATISSSFTLWLLSELPALAEKKDFSQGGGFAKESYYVTLGLFLLSLPGTLSLPFLSCCALGSVSASQMST